MRDGETSQDIFWHLLPPLVADCNISHEAACLATSDWIILTNIAEGF